MHVSRTPFAYLNEMCTLEDKSAATETVYRAMSSNGRIYL